VVGQHPTLIIGVLGLIIVFFLAACLLQDAIPVCHWLFGCHDLGRQPPSNETCNDCGEPTAAPGELPSGPPLLASGLQPDLVAGTAINGPESSVNIPQASA
jgi:hypothetical protein